MQMQFYKPEKSVSGPSYNLWFKVFATSVTILLATYSLDIAMRFPLMQYGFGVKALLLCVALMLCASYYWFLRSAITIDEQGIVQTWLYDRRVEWRDIHSAKMTGIPYLVWLFPSRLVVRTGSTFLTFNGGSREVLIEFAKISRASQMKR
jgi:hypothetical protein